MSNVRLIAITQPVIKECSEPGELVAYCARASNPANQANTETAPRLLGYLARNEHWSPFEMASMTLEIRTTRDIARQILRHRSFSFQEFSQRYAAQLADPVLREARLQDDKNRQASHETDDVQLHAEWLVDQQAVAEHAQAVYQSYLARGIAKEVARAVLPEGLTESVIYMAGTVRSWMHYCMLRTRAGTQKEHRQIAVDAQTILARQFPALREMLGLPEPIAGTEYAISTDGGESYSGSYDSIGAAVAGAQEELACDLDPGESRVIDIGESRPGESYINRQWLGDHVGEWIDERMSEDTGAEESTLELTKEQEHQLGEHIMQWIAVHAPISRFGIEKSFEHTIVMPEAE